jgi:hypothetical protein
MGVAFLVAWLALAPIAPAVAQTTLPGEPNAPAGSDTQHLSTEDTLKFAIDWAKWGKQPESGKVMDTAIAAISIGYPPAGIALGFAKGLITAVAGGSDPVGDALKALDSRLGEVEKRVDDLQKEVAAIRDEQFRQADRARFRELLSRRDEVKRLTNRLRLRPTDAREKNIIAYDAQVLAARFLPTYDADRDVWMWSDLNVYSDQRTGQLASRLLPADFKTMPTFEYYVSALVLWMAAIEYEAGGNTSLVVNTYGKELLKHAAYLSVRPAWHELSDTPQTLPEQVMSRVTCNVEPVSKYPTSLACSARFVCADVMHRTLATVGNTTFNVPTANSLCTLPMRAKRVPSDRDMAQRVADLEQNPRYGSEAMSLWEQWDTPRVVANESAMETEYGVEAMSQLADRIVRLAKYGTTREQYIGKFDMTFYTKQYLYAVKANGEMLWFDHTIAVDKNPPPEPTRGLVQTQSPGVRAIIGATRPAPAAPAAPGSAGGAVMAPSSSAKRVLTGSEMAKDASSTMVTRGPSPAVRAIRATLPPEARVIHTLGGPKLVGTGWTTYSLVIPAGAAGIYGMTPNGVLRWYRHDGYQGGTLQWKGPIDVGTGWNSFTRIVAAGDGVLYGILPDGTLRWNRHLDSADSSARPRWAPARNVGTGWGGFVHVFSTGEGVIYAVPPDGKLLWYRHKGYLTGTSEWEGPKEVGNAGWAAFKRIFSPGEGVIYAIMPDGELLWYQNEGYKDGTAKWQTGRPTHLAADWSDFVQILPHMWGTMSEPVVK